MSKRSLSSCEFDFGGLWLIMLMFQYLNCDSLWRISTWARWRCDPHPFRDENQAGSALQLSFCLHMLLRIRDWGYAWRNGTGHDVHLRFGWRNVPLYCTCLVRPRHVWEIHSMKAHMKALMFEKATEWIDDESESVDGMEEVRWSLKL